MRKIRKFLAVLLAGAMLLPIAVMPAFAGIDDGGDGGVTVAGDMESAFAEGEDSLILFVTGIGQSWSYYFDESYLAPDAFESGTLQDYENYAPLIANEKYIARWNLFNNYFDEVLKDKDFLKAAVRAVFALLFGMFTRTNLVKTEDVDTIVRKLFAVNIIDETGHVSPRVVTPRYVMPVSEYPIGVGSDGMQYSEARNRFFRSIPCEEIAKEKFGDNYGDYLYCYNYCPFSYPTENVAGLHDFIETILADNKVGAKDVVLVPMSMGASVVSAYLAQYPDVADNHVRRVVSIVGCWEGSEIVIDLINREYADNSPDLFYNGIIADMVGEPWGYLVNFALRLFSKKALRSFVDQALDSMTRNIVLATPSLLCLVPVDDYADVREMIPDSAVREQTDYYYAAQSTLRDRLAALEGQGMGISFIAGYGLPYGAVTGDYKAFGFMKHAATTNSDEIIDVSSTAPGTSFVAWDSQFDDDAGRRLSPDRSIDAATAYYPDNCWYFHGQKHELEFNNTALRLAIDLALGNVKSVADCDDAEEDGYFYPQFNGARNVRSVTEDYIPALEKYLKNGGTLTAEQQELYDRVVAMVNSNVNDPAADDALVEDFYMMLVSLGIYDAPSGGPSGFEKVLGGFLKWNNDRIAGVYGSKGFLDFLPFC